MAPTRAQPAAPFVNRELNGEVLLGELADLRGSQLQQKHLTDCVSLVRGLSGLPVARAVTRLQQISAQFAAQPAVARLLTQYAGRLKSDVDVPLLIGHFERLATVSAVVGALRRSADRLPKGLR